MRTRTMFIAGLVSLSSFCCVHESRADLMADWSTCQSGALASRDAKNPTTAEGQYCLGIAYMTGYFGEKNYNLSASWWSKAVAQNHAGAEVALGYLYEKGRGDFPADPSKSFDLYKRSADQGNADAVFNIGRLYYDGTTVRADRATAEQYFQKAASLGCEDARKMLVSMQHAPSGPAPGQDLFSQGVQLYKANKFEEAFQVFMNAANAGNLRAQLQVGSQYERGEGVQQNLQEAARWYQRSADGGDAQAMKNLGQMYENGEGVPENWPLAASLYAKSAELADVSGEFALGRAYQFGIGVPQNRQLAIQWFSKSASLGNSQAAYFAKWLSVPTNNIGFRNDDEHALVIGSKLRFAGDLIGGDPAGQQFNNSQQRTAYLQQLRQNADTTEAMTMWSMRKSNYDQCMSNHGESCSGPGPKPQ